MTLKNNLIQREQDKFVQTDAGSTAVRTLSIGSLIPQEYDYIAATYPSTSTEVYTYKTGGVGGTTVAIITVVYTSDTKQVITSVART